MLFQAGKKFSDAIATQMVEYLLAALLILKNSRMTQCRQMLRNSGKIQICQVGKFTYAGLAFH